MEDAKPRTRRRHDRQLKQQVLQECSAPGASVARVALAHGLNANLVHKWRREVGQMAVRPAERFIPIELSAAAAASAQPPSAIQLELQRGALNVKVSWPMTSSAACAAWLREILR
jgi:transposase